jgi:hypothetical protein
VEDAMSIGSSDAVDINGDKVEGAKDLAFATADDDAFCKFTSSESKI